MRTRDTGFSGSLKPVSELMMARTMHLGIVGLAFIMLLAMLCFHSAGAAECDSSPAPGLDWQECSKRSIMLEGSDFKGANLSGADFSMTDLSDTNMTGTNLEKATLVRAWLKRAKAEKANFDRIEAYRSSFENIAADGASFVAAELERADFNGARLTGTNFEKAELSRADFTKAVLTGSRFKLANLSRADLSGAVFEGPLAFDGAFMFLTRLEGVDLSTSTGLVQAQIELTCGDDKTKLPSGLNRPKNWPCQFD